ncbi:MAG: CoA-transferase [Alphaproteobacteria bacterium]
MKTKLRTAEDCVAAIPDGATVAISGSGGGLMEPDHLLAALEARFLATGHPRDLTAVHALGIGKVGAQGMNRLAHEGMVRRVIGGHWTWSPQMQALAREEKIEAYTLPAGAIMLLMREIGAGRPGLITHVGLNTFADPRHGGGACNARSTDPICELVEIGGRSYIRYLPFKVDFGILRGTQADPLGNVSCWHEAADIDARTVALAAHNSGGKVFAQVQAMAARGSVPARLVTVPGVLVDGVAVDPDQTQTHLGAYDPALWGEAGPRLGGKAPPGEGPEGIRRIIASRAADEIRAGASVNFGYGIPGGIPAILAERGLLDEIWITVEQGMHNGQLLDGSLFGAARYPDAIVSSVDQFDFYSGGGIDQAFLGMGEMDGEGNVNVSRLGRDVVGPGGFVDITQNAHTVVFCGAFEAKGVRYDPVEGGLRVAAPGAVPKLVDRVREITFSGANARATGQTVLYVTERAVFRLADKGVELIEVARGIDVRRDVLDRLGFAPIVARDPAPMDARHFAPPPVDSSHAA